MDELSGKTLEEISTVHEFMLWQMKEASEECAKISRRLSLMANRIELLQTNNLYYMKYRAKLQDSGKPCESVFKVMRISISKYFHGNGMTFDFIVTWEEICNPKEHASDDFDPDIRWAMNEWIDPNILELKKIDIKDLPLYMSWRHKSRLWDELFKGDSK
jgi:hypothetical protein